jgi:hypothetical protein
MFPNHIFFVCKRRCFHVLVPNNIVEPATILYKQAQFNKNIPEERPYLLSSGQLQGILIGESWDEKKLSHRFVLINALDNVGHINHQQKNFVF